MAHHKSFVYIMLHLFLTIILLSITRLWHIRIVRDFFLLSEYLFILTIYRFTIILPVLCSCIECLCI